MGKKKAVVRNRPESIILGAQLRSGDDKAFERVRRALEKEGGNVYRACERLGVAHRTFCNWREKLPKLERLIREERRDAERTEAERRRHDRDARLDTGT